MSALNTTPPRPIDSSALSGWSEQEIFDYTMSRWAERNFELALDVQGSCRYRSEAGPCLIGMLLPDSGYSPRFEGLPFSRLIELIEPYMDEGRQNFLGDFQSMHDSCPRRSEVASRYLNTSIRGFAARNNLTIPAGVEERLNNLGKERAHDAA